ncbi:lytic murein transglycosylase [Nocardia sp. R6R-6]|uniref:lytic murein transglycosylase n=1 Tax=Nocardia sp. R6R-6 TaxID=3459303 RepID=UPI00403DE1C4
MRVSAPVTVSALVVAGVVVSGSGVDSGPVVRTPGVLAAAPGAGAVGVSSSGVVGLLPVSAEGPRRLRAVTPGPGRPTPGIGGQDFSLPAAAGVLGIPEVVLAAYRNAELALESSMPGCGLSWSLLAGIGRVESGHARGGRTDAAGTTVAPIFGPALDGTLPGNEVLRGADGKFVRALGPMQFLPGTWATYAADGNGDGVADPNNVFDAALAAGKYLCSGGADLRDPAQELRAVLRYNHSLAYAGNVLSWSTAYRNGGAPTQVQISPDLIPPGISTMVPPSSEMATITTPAVPDPGRAPSPASPPRPVPPPPPAQVMITIPGLPPIPCGIFCPAPPAPPVDACVRQPIPAPMPRVGRPAPAPLPLAPAEPYGPAPGQLPDPAAARPGDPGEAATAGQPALSDPPAAGCPAPGTGPADTAPGRAADPGVSRHDTAPHAPANDAAPHNNPEPSTTTEPEPAQAAPIPQPGITLPFGIVIPFPETPTSP